MWLPPPCCGWTPGRAADVVWASNAAELYQLLVGQRGWTSYRCKRFLGETWHLVLFPGY
jgi:hypothetical protein